MRERDVHNLIEQQESEAKQRIYGSIKERADFSPSVKKQPRRIKLAVLATVMTCLVVLAVVLPITLRSNKNDGTRFCDASQYQLEQVTQTLKEYSQQNNSGMLYVGWYDVAEDVQTQIAYNVDDYEDIIFFQEGIINGETGEEVMLYITDNKTSVDILENYQNCNEEISVADSVVNWTVNIVSSVTYIKFTHTDYTYYVHINNAYDEQQISQLVADMLNQ